MPNPATLVETPGLPTAFPHQLFAIQLNFFTIMKIIHSCAQQFIFRIAGDSLCMENL
jgi:hypothetical protein